MRREGEEEMKRWGKEENTREGEEEMKGCERRGRWENRSNGKGSRRGEKAKCKSYLFYGTTWCTRLTSGSLTLSGYQKWRERVIRALVRWICVMCFAYPRLTSAVWELSIPWWSLYPRFLFCTRSVYHVQRSYSFPLSPSGILLKPSCGSRDKREH